MGWRFEVHVWERIDEDFRYKWSMVYGGQSIYKAAWVAIRAKQKHKTAVKLEWR